MPAISSIRGELKEAPLQKNPTIASLDKIIAWALMLGMILFELLTLLMACLRLIDGVSAADVMLVAASVCSFSLAALALILWHSFCYYDSRMREFMMWKTKLTPNGFMRIGFVPIPAAASVGLLLFITSTIVSPSLQGGSMLQRAGAGIFLPWLPGMTCTAAAIEAPDFYTRWGARFDRTAPSSVVTMLVERFTHFEKKQAEPEGSCFMTMHEFGKDDVIDPVTGKDRDIPNLNNPMGDKTRLCMYECVTWQTITLSNVLSQLGQLTVGAAIVVEVTQQVSSMIGLPTVKASTTSTELESLFERIGPNTLRRQLTRELQTSMTVCALPILALGFLLKCVIVVKLDADGFNTVDYYVTYSLVYSIGLVTIMRLWNPFENRPQIFTEKLWKNGLDVFIVPIAWPKKWDRNFGRGQFQVIREVGHHAALVKIDLYQWLHLRGVERSILLINKCRRPEQTGTGDGSKMVTLADTEIVVKHKMIHAQSQETVTAHKKIILPKNTQLTLIEWMSNELCKCKATVNGKDEHVVVNRFEVLETSEDWEKISGHYEERLQWEEDCENEEFQHNTRVAPAWAKAMEERLAQSSKKEIDSVKGTQAEQLKRLQNLEQR